MSFYGEDLAHVQQAGFSGWSRQAAPELIRLLDQAGLSGGRVVDLGSGDGSWLAALGQAGYEAVGVDLSPDLLAIAARTAPGATLVQGSAHAVPLPPCDAVTALGEVLSYVPEGEAAPDLAETFERIAAALRPGGLLVFDLMVAGRESLDDRGWREGEGWTVLYATTEDRAARRLTRDIVTFRAQEGGSHVRTVERHVQQVSDPDAVVIALHKAGFAARRRRRLAGLPLPTRRLGFEARRL